MPDSHAALISIEILALIVSVLVASGAVIAYLVKISYQLGQRNTDLDNLGSTVKELREDLDDHEKHCGKREEEIRTRLETGATKFATLEEGQKGIKDDVREIKDLLREQARR